MNNNYNILPSSGKSCSLKNMTNYLDIRIFSKPNEFDVCFERQKKL